MDSPTPMPAALQAFAQILMAKKVMSHEEAKKALDVSFQRFGGDEIDLLPAISRVEAALASMDMGVRSMKTKGASGVTYHCVVNKNADDIAKLYGSRLTEWQVDVFRGIIALFGSSNGEQLRLGDLEGVKTKHKVTNEMMRTFAEHLVEEFWLTRPQNSAGYRLGVRSYVELSELLKTYDLEIPQVIHH